MLLAVFQAIIATKEIGRQHKRIGKPPARDTPAMQRVECDYLVVGSGAASLAFVDTLLDELPEARVVLVDKKPCPGGHWVDAYGFVRLHQPSIVYGLASASLEGSWAKLLVTKRILPWKHRASKAEITQYFQKFVDAKTASGQLQYFPECVFDLGQELKASASNAKSVTAAFASLDGKRRYTAEIREKLVDGVRGECLIPSRNPPEFPVAEGIHLITPNELQRLSTGRGQKEKHFVVLGAGKTAMDTVVFLQTALKVPSTNISWVISNDVWMLSRENSGGPFDYQRALLEADNDKDKACLAMEADGKFVRLEPGVLPTRFRFPMIGKDEVKLMRRVEEKIRRGRVASLGVEDGDVVVRFEEEGREDWVLPREGDKEYVFVHCTSPGPFNGKPSDDVVFQSERNMTLDLLYAPPISISMSCVAKLESATKKGTLNVALGRALLNNDAATPNEILRQLIRGLGIQSTDATPGFLDGMRSAITQASFLALLDADPMVGYRWLKANRLSMFSVPGFKGSVVEDMEAIVAKGRILGAPPAQLNIIRKIAEHLEPLRGK